MEQQVDKGQEQVEHLLQAEVQAQVLLVVTQDNQVQHYKAEVRLVIIRLGQHEHIMEEEYLIEQTTDILVVAEAQVTTEVVVAQTTTELEAVVVQATLILQ